MEIKQYDLIIIGSGPAGLSALEEAVSAGAGKIAMVESYRRLGGECPNWGCMPTKSLLQTVDTLEHCSRGAEFGVPNCGGTVDFAAARDRQRRVVDALTGGPRLTSHVRRLGADLIRGRAEFVGPREIVVRGQGYQAKKFVVSIGTETFVPPISGLDRVEYLTASTTLALEAAPKSMILVGGGPIGVEFSKIFAVFGTKCTIIEGGPHVLPREDHDVAAVVAESLRRLGIEMMTGTKVIEFEKSDGGQVVASVQTAAGGRIRKVAAETVVLATGKRHLWEEMGAATAGVDLGPRGAPILNDFLQTTNRNIYAAGDCAGRMMFTHVAHREGAAAARNAVKGNRHRVDLRVVPRGTYGDPEVGSVGLTEREARAAGIRVAIGLAPFGVLSKAMVTGEPVGLVKIICDRKTGEIIGGHVVGHSAAEIVHTIAVAMRARLRCTDLADMMYAFPTYSEAVGLAAMNVR